MGHVLMENRHGLAVSVRLTQASGTTEREAALEMMGQSSPKAEEPPWEAIRAMMWPRTWRRFGT